MATSASTAVTEAEAGQRMALLDIESYELFLDLAGEPDRFRSRAVIRFRCRQPGAATFADLTAAEVSRAVLNGRELDPGREWSGGRLRLAGLAEANVLEVDAVCDYRSDGRGLTRFADPADGAVYLFAMCYPTDAPSVFCCFDQLDLRAELSLTVSAPAGWDCVSNGAVTQRPPEGEAGVWRFASVAGLKPYDFTLCAGPYVLTSQQDYQGTGGSVRLTVRCRASLADSAGLAPTSGAVRQALACYERLLGVPCPYPKLDILFVPELAPGAVQLPAVMGVNEMLMQRAAEAAEAAQAAGPAGDATGAGDEFATMVLAHETAHLWFGCLVEGRWWDDLWLAEAMATYLSYLACASDLGHDAPWAQFCMQGEADACRQDSLPGTLPVSSPVASAADAMARPAHITYSKGAAVIRQLAALVGDEAMRDGLHRYLTGFRGAAASLADLTGCWSQASGRDLTGWSRQWLQAAGVNLLRPELTLAADGSVASAAVCQEPPPAEVTGQDPATGDGLRTHRITVGAYRRDGDGRLHRYLVIDAELDGPRTVLPELAGAPAPDAVIVNDGDETFARIRFDDRSLRALTGCALDTGDPLTEAVCWNAAWDMTTSAEMAVAAFTDLVIARLGRAGQDGRWPAGLAELLAHAVAGADRYAVPAQRPDLRQRLAAAALTAAGLARPGSRARRELTAGFAASAQDQDQLGLLRSWLDGQPLPGGGSADASLRAVIVATLAARGQVSEADLDALAAGDPVDGQAHRATCAALRPDRAAKEAAWAAALDEGQSPRMARAWASGLWAAGRDELLAGFGDRFFTEALPALRDRDRQTAQRLIRCLYPGMLADPATIAATEAVLAAREPAHDAAAAGDGQSGDRPSGLADAGVELAGALRLVLAEQLAILRQVITARAAQQA